MPLLFIAMQKSKTPLSIAEGGFLEVPNAFIETIVRPFPLKCLFSMKIEKLFPIYFNIFYDL